MASGPDDGGTPMSEPLARQTYLTVPQLADLLQVKRSTIYSWTHKKSGPPFLKVGNVVRFRRDDVDRWLRDHTEGPTDE